MYYRIDHRRIWPKNVATCITDTNVRSMYHRTLPTSIIPRCCWESVVATNFYWMLWNARFREMARLVLFRFHSTSQEVGRSEGFPTIHFCGLGSIWSFLSFRLNNEEERSEAKRFSKILIIGLFKSVEIIYQPKAKLSSPYNINIYFLTLKHPSF